MFESRMSAEATEKMAGVGETSRKKLSRGPTTWKVSRKKCVERFCELAHKKDTAV